MSEIFSTSTTFADLGLGPDILKGIEEQGFEHPTMIQATLIPPALEGKDILGQSKTGTGKTAAFGLPALQIADKGSPFACLCLVPTRELAIQVARECRELGRHTGLKVLPVYGGVGYGRSNRPDNSNLNLTLQALQRAEGLQAADMLARFYAQLGQLEWQTGNTAASLDATRRAVGVLEETRPEADAAGGRADVAFRQGVEPVYRSLVDRLLQTSADAPSPAAQQAQLDEARRVLQSPPRPRTQC